MKKVFLLMATTALFSFEAVAECVSEPSCTDLGFTRTESDCPTGSVKCPWNTALVYCQCSEDYKYTCTGTNETAGSDKCGSYYASCGCNKGYGWAGGKCKLKCNVGDIYYTDNTCVATANHNTSKTVLGIVVYVNPNGIGGQMMRADAGTANWGSSGYNVFNLPDYSAVEARKDFDSCGNTKTLLSDVQFHPAAGLAKDYNATTETKGKWCLPAMGIWFSVHKNLNVIRAAYQKVGWPSEGFNTDDILYSSSTERDSSMINIYSVGNPVFNDGSSGGYHTYKDDPLNVRPVLEF